jgi:DNA repair protein RadC
MSELLQVNEVKLSYKSKQKASERPRVLRSQDTYKLLLTCYDSETIEYRESFKVLLLNRMQKVLGVFNVSEGGISACIVDIKMVLQAALLGNASNIIISHNHPSGNMQPSKEDDYLTTRIQQACKLLDIGLLDHVIIGTDSFYSYADDGRL